MLALADCALSPPAKSSDPIECELEVIEQLREKALENPDILYFSPVALHLVEREIPRLIEVIRRFKRTDRGSVIMTSPEWTQALLLELRDQVSIVRDLVEWH